MSFDLSLARASVGSLVRRKMVDAGILPWRPVAVRPAELSDIPEDGGTDALWVLMGKAGGVSRWECLDQMPHLLVAGTTGSGKSVFLDALLASLLVRHTPRSLRIGLVDRARVSFRKYRSLPHLLGDVRCDISSAYDLIHQCTLEMERRLELFGDLEKISEYNRVSGELLPRWVIVIDEFAYLLASAKKVKETKEIAVRLENELNDLAAVARKTGIHLVLATQKPLATIVDSVMKSNFPSRVAFRVSSSSDSRVILDKTGAELLGGCGDMLFQSPVENGLERIKGTLIGSTDLAEVIRGG